MLLDTSEISALQKEFEKEEDGLTLTDFVFLMKRYIKGSSFDEVELVANLRELFLQIDVNGDGTMEWDEFTSYIVDCGNKDIDSELQLIPTYFQVPIDDHVYAHVSNIGRLHFLPHLERLCIFEHGSRELGLYTPRCFPAGTVTLDEGGVLAVAHIAELSQFAIASTKMELLFFDDQYHRLQARMFLPVTQACLEWAPRVNVLFSAGITGAIHAWDVVGKKEKMRLGGMKPGGFLAEDSHSDMVTDLLYVDSLESLFSASMDRTIRIWDVHTGKFLRVLKGHYKGVRSLAYSKSYRILVSAGFDYEACVWNPFVERLTFRLQGHAAPLCRADIADGSHQIITVDEVGIVKVWDMRKFECLQTLNTPDPIVSDLCVAESYKSFFVGGRRLFRFCYEGFRHANLADDHEVSCVLYNETFAHFVTACGPLVKIWDAKTGKILKTYRNFVSEGVISSLCLDDRERKLILGTDSGEVKVFEYLNGAKMKELESVPPTARQISKLIYCGLHKVLIKTGWDGAVAIYDEIDPEEVTLLRQMSGSHQTEEIDSVAYSSKLSLVASATSGGEKHISLWDYEFGTLVAFLIPNIPIFRPRGPSKQAPRNSYRRRGGRAVRQFLAARPQGSITAVEFIDNYFAGLIGADDAGFIHFWTIRPSPLRMQNRSVFRLKNPNGGSAPLVIRVYDDLIFSADEEGYIVKWCFRALIKELKQVGCHAPSQVLCQNSRRGAQTNISEMAKSTLAETESQTKHIEPLFQATLATLEASWHAHEDSINSLEFISFPQSLVTSSADCVVKIFDFEGHLLGRLCQGESDVQWRFNVDEEARRKAKLEQAAVLLRKHKDAFPRLKDQEEDAATTELELEDSRDALSDFNTRELTWTKDVSLRKTPRRIPIRPSNAGRGFSVLRASRLILPRSGLKR